jgi:sigma-B regulation protein RsbU (phosphoserine phosphatase)
VVNPGEVLRKLNTLLIPESESATFVTVFFGVLNIRTGEMQFCNGAHNSPYLLKTTGAVEQLPLTDGSILGKIPHMDFETKRVKLDKGDTLYLYTDGVTEAMDPESAQYEDVRLKSYLGSARKLSIRELIQGNIQDLKKHTRGANQSDDITLLALRYLGAA